MDINYSHWEVDPEKGIALHESGAILRFTGHPDSDSFEGNLHAFPANLSALEKVRLVRHGFEAYRKAFAQKTGRGRPTLSQKHRSNAEIT